MGELGMESSILEDTSTSFIAEDEEGKTVLGLAKGQLEQRRRGMMVILQKWWPGAKRKPGRWKRGEFVCNPHEKVAPSQMAEACQRGGIQRSASVRTGLFRSLTPFYQMFLVTKLYQTMPGAILCNAGSRSLEGIEGNASLTNGLLANRR